MIDNRIQTFLTLCRLMNYRKTAEELNMTQPAVTQHIHYLENQYRCKLFIYDRKKLRITYEAELLKQYAENVLYQERKIAEQIHAHEEISLSIGATKTIGEYVIADQVSRFLANPKNRISIEVDNTQRLLQLLSVGELDFALIEGFFDRKQYASRLYRTEPFVGLCGKTHPFAERTISIDKLWDEDLILREKGSGTRNILEQLLNEKNHTIADFYRVTDIGNFGLMSRLLEEGNRITFAYQAVKNKNDNLSIFNVEGWNVIREFNYVFLDNPFSIRAVNYFDSLQNE